MTSPRQSGGRDAATGRRSNSAVAAFLVGLPLGAAILGLFYFGPLRGTPAARYVQHPVEAVEVVLFCCSLGALGAKLARSFPERRALRAEVLPPWDGRPVPVEEAGRLLAGLTRLPRRLQDTYLVNRTAAVLHFLCNRRSAADLDDQLRALADDDAVAQENSYSLVRFITWAIPILGFLGTVLGITGAISGVTPERLEQDLSTVTDGLALAFDTTALALGLTMVTMFCSFLTERTEQSILGRVDRFAERELAHRFERPGSEGGVALEGLRGATEIMRQTTEQLVQRQVELWARTFEERERLHHAAGQQQQELFLTAMETALEETLNGHAARLAAMERQVVERSTELLQQLAAVAVAVRDTGREQQAAFLLVADGLAAQTAALAQVQEGENNLLRLQETLNQNLAALGQAGNFEQVLQSLTAAVHLLTARTVALPGLPAGRAGPRPGAAA